MLASPIFHHSRHISVFLLSPLPPPSLSRTRTQRHLLAIPSSSWLSLFRYHPLVFACAASLFRSWLQAQPRHISHLHSAKTLVSSFIPTQLPRFHLLPFSLGENFLFLSRSLAVPYSKPNPKRAERYPHYHSCSRQRKVCLDRAFILFPSLRRRPALVRILVARNQEGESWRVSFSSGVI